VCPAHFIADALALPAEQLRRYRFFRGHFFNLPGSIVPRTRTLTFLRDPVERSLSHYHHVAGEPDRPLFARTRELGGLLPYLEDPVMRRSIANFQARSLVWRYDARALAARFTPEQLDRKAMESHLEADMLPHLSAGQLLERAIERLDSFVFVGLTEHFEESLARLFSLFRWGEPGPGCRANVAPVRLRQSDLGARERDLLYELTEVDRQLYAYAERRFRRHAAARAAA
jgi:hypothetical protein